MSTGKVTLLSLVPEIEITMGSCVIDEEYPHVSENLILFWGEPEFLDQIEKLLNYTYDRDRPSRQGFPFRVIQELELSLQSHLRKFPNIVSEYTSRVSDVWGSGA